MKNQNHPIKIGILSKNYAAKRLFLNKLREAKYYDIRFNNWLLWRRLLLLIRLKLNMLKLSPEEIVAKLFYDFKAVFPTGCQVFHFFNCINHSKKSPWVISVESAVPWPINVARIVESEKADFAEIKNDKYICERIIDLASSNCLALLPLCHCSYHIQMELLKQFPEYYTIIKNKTMTLHPPQELIIHDIAEKGLSWKDDETFTFFYVGRNYFRKGGRECVEVLAELHKKYNFRLILVSSLSVDESKYLRTEYDDEEAKRLIKENQSWIEFYNELPNAGVIDKLKQSHICLLPTWMDTYAYSVLESQACGTPLITTSLRALTEINGTDVGWTVKVPTNRLNNPLLNTQEQQDIFYKKLKIGLKEKIEYVLTHRDEVKKKSENCLKSITQYHNPQNYIEKIRMVYDGKIGELIKANEKQ